MSRRVAARAMVLLGVVVVSGLLSAAVAAAHPLGLPAFARVAATGPDEVTVVWNAAPDDVAELARSLGVDVEPSGLLTEEQDAALSSSPQLAETFEERLVVRQDGRRCPGESEVESLVADGATLRARCPAPVDEIELEVRLLSDIDSRYRTLVVAGGPEGAQRWMLTGTAPRHTFELDEAAAPQVLTAASSVDAGPEDEGAVFGGSLPFESRFVALIDGPAGFTAMLLGGLLALGVGAAHGLAPGHGKTLAGAYLVGDRGRPRDAMGLGVAVAAMHTGSVLVLGFALYGVTQRPNTAALSHWLQVVAGSVVVALGCWLLHRRWRERRHGPAHADALHHHTHTYVPADASPLSWQGLVTLGAAGGLLPSPSALLVLFTALAIDRLAYGLSLIALFGLGLAATVTAAGLVALWGREAVASRLSVGHAVRMVRTAPLVAASVVVVLGAVIAMRGVSSLV